MKKDYYAILGVTPGASDKEIRSAYKRLARKHHPDLNAGDKQSEERFKEISEAYEVLSDPHKKRAWESGEAGDFESFFRQARARGGSRGGPRSRGEPFAGFEFAGGDLGDIFEQMFRGASSRGEPGARSGPGRDLAGEASISFEDAARGTTIRIPLARTVACPECQGLGRLRSGRSTRACPRCHGAGTQRANEEILVRIPPGATDGARVRVPGKGEAGPGGGPAGDLFVELRVAPHRWFRLDGRDVVLELPLTIAEAALGTRLDVPTLDGKVTLKVPAGSRSGQRLRLKGRGIAGHDGDPRGDQIVVLQIVTPSHLDPRSRRLLEELAQIEQPDPRAGLGW